MINHKMKLEVNQVYSFNHKFIYYDWGYSMSYNRSNISFFILRNEKEAVDFLNSYRLLFNKVTIYCLKKLKNLNKNFIEISLGSNRDLFIDFDKYERKRLNRLKKTLFDNFHYKIIESAKKEEMISLFNIWLNEKKSNPQIYQITLSPNRYKHSIYFINKKNHLFFSVYTDSKIRAIYHFYIDGKFAYYISAINRRDLPAYVRNEARSLFYEILKRLYQKGIKGVFLGTAEGVQKSLKTYKMQFMTDFIISKSYCDKNFKQTLNINNNQKKIWI